MTGPSSAEFVQRFRRSIENNLGAEKAALVFNAYDIIDSASENENYTNILNFGNDIGFLAPVLCYAHGWDAYSFVYFFTEPNTWDGPWKNRANHILDVAYLFQNYNVHLSPAQQETAIAFGTDLINFANGRAPWPVFNFAAQEINAKVYGATNPQSVSSRIEVVSGPNTRTERRQTIFNLSLSIPLTRLSEAWNAFLTGQ
jgi:carboxylesterase type B